VTSTGAIERMRLDEGGWRGLTEFVFSDLKENVPVKDSDFWFCAAAG